MADRSITIKIGANIAGLRNGLSAAKSQVKGFGSDLKRSAQENREAWTQVGTPLLAVGAGMTAVGAAAAKTGIQYNTLQQTSRAALTSLLGSTSAAADQMDRLNDFARNSPFAKDMFISAQQQMLAFGIEAEKVVPYLDAIQNAVAAAGGSNTDIEGIVATMSKIQSSAKITAQDLNEFGNRGVNAAELIGSQMGMTGAEIREGITAGTLNAGQALDALAAGMTERFDGAADGVKDTFLGAMDRVKAAYRDLASEMSLPLVDPDGGGMAVGGLNALADAMRKFESLPDGVRNATVALGGLTAVAATGAGAFLLLAPRVADTVDAFGRLRGAHPGVVSGLGKVAKAAGVAAAAFTAMQTAQAVAENFQTMPEGVEATTKAMLDGGIAGQAMADSFAKLDNGINGFASTDIDSLTGSIDRLVNPRLMDRLNDFGGEMLSLGGAQGATDREAVIAQLDNVGNSLATLVQNGHAERAASEFEKLSSAWQASGGELDDLKALVPGYIGALDAAGVQQELTGESAEGMAGAVADATEAMQEQVDAANDAYDAMRDYSDGMSSSRGALRDMYESIDKANEVIKENGEGLDITTGKGRDNEAALYGIRDATLAAVDEAREMGASQKELRDIVREGREAFLDQADAAGKGKGAAKDLAVELGLIPKDITTKVTMKDHVTDELESVLTEMGDKSAVISVKGDTGPLGADVDNATAKVDEAEGTVTIFGDDGQALTTLSDYTATINESDGTVTVKGKDKEGRKTVVSFTGWIGKQEESVKVDADMDNAWKSLNAFRDATKKPLYTEVNGKMVYSFGGPGATGDGEGAGWSGSTPRGVSQMSQAVQSMDPGARITSGYRPGAITSTGYPSFHGMGRAIDIVSPNMGRTWDILARAFGSKAKELYYTPRGFIRNGRMTNDVAAVTRRQHYSHVHLALAQGGRLPGVAPANPRKDNLLGVDEHGTPLARIRSREWVVNQPASDYYGDGIMSALNSRQIPRELLEHLPGLAGGGAVGGAKGDLKRARRALDRARKARRDAKGDKARDRAQKAVDKAEARVDDERERLSRLRDERGDLRVDRRRGNIRDSATSGLSGAYGVADEMLELADSGDLGKRRSNRLEKRAKKAEKAMRGLYKQAERLDTRLEKAKAKLEDIASIKANVGSALASEQSLSEYVQSGAFRDVTRTNSRGETWTESVWDKGGAGTAKGLVAGAKATAARLKKFSNKLGKLRRLGLSKTILEEIAEAGSEDGMALADAFLADRGQIKGINAAYKDIAKHSNSAGKQVAESFGLSAAQSLVKGLEKQESKVGRQIERWGVRMANGLIGALGGKKIKARANGGPVSAGTGYLVGEEGPELIVPSKSGYVMTAEQTRRLASTAHTVRRSDVAHQSGSSVTVNVAKVVAADTQAAVDRMYTKSWDAINANNVVALSQGVGV